MMTIKDKKKILYFIQLPPPLHGVTKLNQFVYKSWKINRDFQKDLLEIRYSDNLSQLQKFTFGKLLNYFLIGFRLIKKLYSFIPDYVYFTIVPTGVGFYKDLFFMLIIKLSHATPILHLHGKGIKEKTKNKFVKKIYEIAFSNCIIIHLSENLQNEELGKLNLKNTKLCYVENGVNQIKTNKIIRKGKYINILFLSNLFETKGIFVALKAFKELSKKKDNIILHLVGGMSDKIIEEKIRNLILENNLNVIVHGALYGKNKYAILSQSDIFIHPTLNDAFPLVLMEAMQFKLPVISTFQGAIPDIVDDNITGFLVKEGDVITLYEKMLYLVENPEIRQKLGENGYSKYLKKYTLKQFENNMTKTFKKYLV